VNNRITKDPFNRPPRIQDVFEPLAIEIPQPPQKPEEKNSDWIMSVLPVTSTLLMSFFYLFIYSLSSSRTGSFGWLFALPMVVMGISSFFISLVLSNHQKHQAKVNWAKTLRDYYRQLDKKESRLISAYVLEQNYLNNKFPDSETLENDVHNLSLNLWERRIGDADFLELRFGSGDLKSLSTIKPPDPDLASPYIRDAYRIFTKYRELKNAPITVGCENLNAIAIIGQREEILPFLNNLVLQIFAKHSPADLEILLISQRYRYKIWNWLRWLPHTDSVLDSEENTNLAFDNFSAELLLRKIINKVEESQDVNLQDGQSEKAKEITPSVLIVDGHANLEEFQAFAHILRNGRFYHNTTFLLCENLEDVPSEVDSIVFVRGNQFKFDEIGIDGISLEGKVETISQIRLENLARRINPITVSMLGQTSQIPSNIDLLDVYKIKNVREFNLPAKWNRIPNKGILPFPIMVGSMNLIAPLTMNLSENNDGPHGLIAGTTGAGKSELLQTLISSLAIEHHPYFVNFLLIDFKGGSTFNVFRDLPHTVGFVSNLDSLAALRTLEAIKAENLRRQKFLADNGCEDITEYHMEISRQNKIPVDWKPLPHLFIIVDEFAQLAKEMPNFLPELVATIRIGRSLGLHLILATQKPGGIVTDQMRANLNFRICLRVQTVDDSRDMLSKPDAALLPPNIPGRAFFQLGDVGAANQFQVGRVGTDYVERSDHGDDDSNSLSIYAIKFEEKLDVFEQGHSNDDKIENRCDTLAEVIVKHINNYYDLQNQNSTISDLEPILLDELPEVYAFSDLLEAVEEGVAWNHDCLSWQDSVRSEISIPVGIVDDLESRSQPPLEINFGRHGGHVALIGAQATGKTTFIRSLLLGAAYCYSPIDINFYIVSFAGRSLNPLKAFPHVGDVITSDEQERIGRLFDYLLNEVERRKILFEQVEADDLQQFNQLSNHDNRLPVICVIIDNFSELRDESFDKEFQIAEKLIRDARSYGINFVISAQQVDAIPYKIFNLFETRLAFHQVDTADYSHIVGRRNNLQLADIPGRGLINFDPPKEFQIAFPVSNTYQDSSSGNLDDIASTMKAAWKGKLPFEIQNLPQIIKFQDLWERANLPMSDAIISLIGLSSANLKNKSINWVEDGPHFVISGPPKSGKTTAVKSLLLSLAAQYSPELLKIVLIDGSQHSLSDIAKLPHVIEWVKEKEGLSRSIANLLAELEHRRKEFQNDAFSTPTIDLPMILFAFDDYDLTMSAWEVNDLILSQMGQSVRQDSRLGFFFIMASLPNMIENTSDPLLRQVKLMRSGIALTNSDAIYSLGGRPSSMMRHQELSEGRGYLLIRGDMEQIKIAMPNQDDISGVINKWNSYEKAKWQNPADLELQTKVNEDIDQPITGKSNWKKSDLIDTNGLIDEYLSLKRKTGKGDD
jgi:S-DNA-T family DNA segregation ATPase FtsK/SpoIIIE